MSRIFAIELVGPQKFELSETIQWVWKVTHLDSAWLDMSRYAPAETLLGM